MIRVVDTERHKREEMARLNSKESKREVERKREEKDIEKMIKLANRAQMKMGEKGQREEVKEVTTKGIFTFEVDSVPKTESSFTMPEPIQKKEMMLPKFSLFSSA
jgi:CO dehydrogenase/acetyl-CoA synthase epsilon subunit